MALPAKVYWAKLQKELKGKSQPEQINILRQHVMAWPPWNDIQYRKMREQAEKMLHKLETNETVKSSKGHQDLFHIKRQGDGQFCLVGLTNSGKSAIASTLTAAPAEVADYAFTTQHPIPGMLDHRGAALQIIDTPALVAGTSEGEGAGRRLLHLISMADASGIVIDLSQDLLEQMNTMVRELSAAQIQILPHPVRTELHLRSKGGIKFTGHPIAKDDQSEARQILASAEIAHAEIRIREDFSANELVAQVVHKHLLPSVIIANKNDVPEAKNALDTLRQAFPAYPIVDVNFLDEVHFDLLKDYIFRMVGLVRLFVLDKPDQDAERTRLVLPKASTIAEVAQKLSELEIHAANLWGASVKYAGQEVGIDHIVEDGDLIYLQG